MSTAVTYSLVCAAILAAVLLVMLIDLRIVLSHQRDLLKGARVELEKCRNTIDEQALMLVEMQDRNERLHRDLRRMRERLPNLTRDEALAMDADDPDPARPYIKSPEATP